MNEPVTLRCPGTKDGSHRFHAVVVTEPASNKTWVLTYCRRCNLRNVS